MGDVHPFLSRRGWQETEVEAYPSSFLPKGGIESLNVLGLCPQSNEPMTRIFWPLRAEKIFAAASEKKKKGLPFLTFYFAVILDLQENCPNNSPIIRISKCLHFSAFDALILPPPLSSPQTHI